MHLTIRYSRNDPNEQTFEFEANELSKHFIWHYTRVVHLPDQTRSRRVSIGSRLSDRTLWLALALQKVLRTLQIAHTCQEFLLLFL